MGTLVLVSKGIPHTLERFLFTYCFVSITDSFNNSQYYTQQKEKKVYGRDALRSLYDHFISFCINYLYAALWVISM